MNKQEIQGIVDKYRDDWYYYYNFDGTEIKPKLKDNKTCGFYNWEKIKPVMQGLFDEFESPVVFDIGCNMALYDHEMTKMRAHVIGMDKKAEIEQASFYRRFLTENKKETWQVELIEGDISLCNKVWGEVNIITLFCVIYHLRPSAEYVFNRFDTLFPNHKYVVIQGNIPRVNKRGQEIAGVDGIKEFLKKQCYSVYKTYEWNGYQKPVVIGERAYGL